MTTSNRGLIVKSDMLIRKPVQEVFEAFVNPAITTKFWFTKSSGRLEPGQIVRWDWEMYGVGTNVDVKEMEENHRILIEWGEEEGKTTVEWHFTARSEDETLVSITNTGFQGDQKVAEAIDSMGGFTMVLCGLKAYLEHNIMLNLIADKAPDANVGR